MLGRKAFNFYKSYYDIVLELPDEEKLPFLMAIFDMQFNGNETQTLSGMAKFAFISQKHSLLKQLDGYIHGVNGGRPPKGTQKGSVTIPPKGTHNQEKGEGEEEVQEEEKEKGEAELPKDGELELLKCLDIALKDNKWVRRNKTTSKELGVFVSKLEKEGVYYKVPIDFKSHFSRWKNKNPTELSEPKTTYIPKMPQSDNRW